MSEEHTIEPEQEQFIIPIGARVRIKDNPHLGMLRSFHANQEATVIGYRPDNKQRTVTCTTMLQLKRDGDVWFKWPQLFPWEVERIDQQSSKEHTS
jgi:hypothetical protein